VTATLTIARKYFFSSRVKGVVHVISGVTALGIMVSTAALVIILSVFNGFEQLVVSLYNSFDPDVKIIPVGNKYLPVDSQLVVEIGKVQGVSGVSPVLEENILAKYANKQTFARIKGLHPHFLHSIGMDSAVFVGEMKVNQGNNPYALIGMGVAGKLGVNIYDDFSQLQLYVPKADKKVIINPRRAFNQESIRPSGIFSIQREFDDKFLLVPLDFAQQLTGRPGQATAIEVNLDNSAHLPTVVDQIARLAPTGTQVLDRYQQHAFLYKILRSEKTVVFLILTFVLIIAAFNLVASLSMLSVEKKKDIAILNALGMSPPAIGRVFLFNGLLLSVGGALVGLALGTLLCWVQERFGVVGLGGTSFVTNSYPVDLRFGDVALVFFTVLAIGLLSSWLPSMRAANQFQPTDLHMR
jgi:lipoprotein-releasing system permease protein